MKAGIPQSEISCIEAAHANPDDDNGLRALGAEVRLVAGKKRASQAKGALRWVAASSARLVRRRRRHH